MQEYFTPIDIAQFTGASLYTASSYGKLIKAYVQADDFPELEGMQLAIIGVEEDRKAVNNEGCGLAADYVRENLYRLFQGNYSSKIADLGNIRKGNTIEDTYFAVTDVLAQLLKKNIIPIVIGGSQDLTYCNYLAYQKMEQTINIVSVDSAFDIGDGDKELNSQSYLSKIILHKPNILFNYSNVGFQTYFVEQNAIGLMDKLYFDAHRLGHVRKHIENVEPIVRNADVVSFDVSSIRQSDAPGNGNASPNGFYGEEACQITRYAGMSDKLSSIGFYEINPAFDNNKQTAHLAAQMIWYFIDGFYNRKQDYPIVDKSEYTKYRVSITNHEHEIVFYKSNKSDRWWMDVPYPVNHKIKFERHHMVPCSYSDYETACQDEMPDKWWQTFQKLG
ncbi:MAG: arginase family hydrolase, arginase/agmainase/formiminoglutamate hydrolase [Bacteroidetes bacterium]|nr:arginase family hydrolase, arginase/agmainase/formiminoglutamate hydrolase [Bacteroidota bacterium]